VQFYLFLVLYFQHTEFSAGIGLAVFGLIIIVVSLIVFVVATDSIDTKGPAALLFGP